MNDALPLLALIFLVAGLVKGLAGMGLPTLAMALLGLTMPPTQAATLMVLPSLVTNVAQCLGPHWRVLARQLWPLWTGLALVTIALPLPASIPWARAGLGGVLLIYGVWGLARPSLPDLGRWGLVAGALTGLITAATGVFVMPLVPYLQSLKLEREALMQALGLSFAVATMALMLRLGRIAAPGLQPEPLACAVATGCALAGLWLGIRLRRRLSAARFQQALYGAFVLLGILLISR